VKPSALRLFALISAALLLGAAQPAPTLLREQAWTAPGNVSALMERPGGCLAARTPETEIGRALFRSPSLLGGTAARAGLSCEACHASGRVNAHFLLPELTDRAGAADVTSEWASRVRGDGIHNPRDIPDLVDVFERQAFGRAADPSLEHFVAGVIEEEFQGAPPPPEALAALLAYLRALRSNACAETHALNLTNAAEDVRRALAAAAIAQDRETARLVLLSAQDAMGLLVERMPTEDFSEERRRLSGLSRELGAWRNAENLAATLATAGPGWRARFDAVVETVSEREQDTYYNQRTLRAALAH
jgi:hypothetical protein